MDNKKIIDMKYTVDENGKPVSATVIYDDNTYKNAVNDPSQVIEWATQVARENPKENIRHIMRRASSEDALRRALEADLSRVDENGNQILHDGETNDDTIEQIKDKHKFAKGVAVGVTAAGLGAAGLYGISQLGANGNDTQNVAIASAKETASTDELISDQLKDRLQLTDFQREFLENAEATIDQYNSLCEKYGLDDDFKISLDEYLAAYINYNDLSINETKELIPMLMNADNAETMDVNYIQTCLQSINSKFLGMSVSMTDPEDVSVFDGFIQDVTGSMTEREADMEGLTGEERENQLANLNKCRSIMREMWTHFVESNNSGELCGDDFYNFVSESINEEVNGISTGSAFYRMFADTYLTCGGIHSANYDEIINARTHEQRSFDDSTQENQNEMSLSDNVVTHSNKVCGSIDERINTAWNDAREWFKETYAMMEEEGVTTDIKYYVNSEYNEEYNKLREKYKDIELFNVNDDEKAAKLADLVNNYLHTHGRSWDGNLSNYTASVSGGGTTTTTTTTETWTETIPEDQQPVINAETEYNEKYQAGLPVISDQATIDNWRNEKQEEVNQGKETTLNGEDMSDSMTTDKTVQNDQGGYDQTHKEYPDMIWNEEISDGENVFVDGIYDLKDEQGNLDGTVHDDDYKAPETNNPETEHLKDKMEEYGYNADNRLPDDQTTFQPEAEAPAQDTPVVEEPPAQDTSVVDETPSAPEVEEPVIDNTPSTPDDGIPGDNTDVTHDANTDGSSVGIEVGDLVPLAASNMDESATVSEENVFDEYGQLSEQTIESLNSSESVVETTPEPVVETVAPESAPVVTEPVVETPAPESAPVVTEPVVETPAPESAPVVTEPVVETPAPEPAPVVTEPVVETPASEPAPVVTEPVVETPAPESAPVVTEPVVETPAPEPIAETTSSSVTVEVDGDLATFDGAGNLTNVEPAPVAEETNENVKTM